MENVVYSHAIVDSPRDEDGYASASVYLTEEPNGFLLFHNSEAHVRLVNYYPTRCRNEAVEAAVEIARLPDDEIIKRCIGRAYPSSPTN